MYIFLLSSLLSCFSYLQLLHMKLSLSLDPLVKMQFSISVSDAGILFSDQHNFIGCLWDMTFAFQKFQLPQIILILFLIHLVMQITKVITLLKN